MLSRIDSRGEGQAEERALDGAPEPVPARAFPPETLRQYALVADGERGALIGPRGDVAFLCAPRWHDDAVFSALVGGAGTYAVTPTDQRFVWGGHYEPGSLVWRSRWVTTDAEIESREALARPSDPRRAVLLRRVEAHAGDADVTVALDVRAGFGQHRMEVERVEVDGATTWQGRSGPVHFRWSGAPAHTHLRQGRLAFRHTIHQGGHLDLVLELSHAPLGPPTVPDEAWRRTVAEWSGGVPADGSAAPGDSTHSWAVLRGLTSASGGMVAAATTALPERARQGRDYDYRYAWLRDQCYAGRAGAVAGAPDLLDAAVRFVGDRVLDAGDHLRPAYTVDGDPLPDARSLPLPGYPGAPVLVGNRATGQFQLDVVGEALLLFAEAARLDRLDDRGHQVVDRLVDIARRRGDEPDAGIWELDDRRWAHSRLMVAAGLRAVAGHRGGPHAEEWQTMADRVVASVDRDCRHPSGRWQRSPEDPSVDASLLLPGLRGAVPADDPRHRRTWHAVVEDLADDGYVYRFRHDDRPLHEAEGAFLLCGFVMAMVALQQGDRGRAWRWFERNRSAVGPPGLFSEEFDVVERQLRGNLPQAFVHALLLESAHCLGRDPDERRGFEAGSAGTGPDDHQPPGGHG